MIASKRAFHWPGRLVRGRRLHPATVLGSCILFSLIVVAVFAPWLAPFDPVAVSPEQTRLLPSWQHPLGTDYAGRDIFSRLLYSIRLAYWGGMLAVTITAIVGTTLGLFTVFYGGWFDTAAMWVVNLWLALPGLLFLLATVAITGSGFYQVVVAVGLAGIPAYTRLVRGVTFYQMGQPYVEAARAIGASPLRITFGHIVPNLLAPLATYLAISFGSAILAAGALGFIGLSGDPSIPELGQLLREGREVMNQLWWPMLGPILVLWLTMLGASLVSDGISEGRGSFF